MTETEWTHVERVKVEKQGHGQGFRLTTNYLPHDSIGHYFELKFRALKGEPTVEELREEKMKVQLDAIKKSYEKSKGDAFGHVCGDYNFEDLVTMENLKKYPKILRKTKRAFLKIRKGKLAEFLKSDLNIEYEDDVKADIFNENLIEYFIEDVQKALSDYDPDLVEVSLMDLKDGTTKKYTEELSEVSLKIDKSQQRRTLGKKKAGEEERLAKLREASEKAGVKDLSLDKEIIAASEKLKAYSNYNKVHDEDND